MTTPLAMLYLMDVLNAATLRYLHDARIVFGQVMSMVRNAQLRRLAFTILLLPETHHRLYKTHQFLLQAVAGVINVQWEVEVTLPDNLPERV
jgi:hypothetical protein